MDVYALSVSRFLRSHLRRCLVCVFLSWALLDAWEKNRGVRNGAGGRVRLFDSRARPPYVAYLIGAGTMRNLSGFLTNHELRFFCSTRHNRVGEEDSACDENIPLTIARNSS